jgi:hypothetical protein
VCAAYVCLGLVHLPQKVGFDHRKLVTKSNLRLVLLSTSKKDDDGAGLLY